MIIVIYMIILRYGKTFGITSRRKVWYSHIKIRFLLSLLNYIKLNHQRCKITTIPITWTSTVVFLLFSFHLYYTFQNL